MADLAIERAGRSAILGRMPTVPTSLCRWPRIVARRNC